MPCSLFLMLPSIPEVVVMSGRLRKIALSGFSLPRLGPQGGLRLREFLPWPCGPVSYTHLTLPTIYSV